MMRPPPRFTLFPYTTLFRSVRILRLPAASAPAARRVRRSKVGPLAQVRLAEDDHAGKTNQDRKSTRLNSSHVSISYAVFCLKKKNDILDVRPLVDLLLHIDL